jgi:hypothetical protein
MLEISKLVFLIKFMIKSMYTMGYLFSKVFLTTPDSDSMTHFYRFGGIDPDIALLYVLLLPKDHLNS